MPNPFSNIFRFGNQPAPSSGFKFNFDPTTTQDQPQDFSSNFAQPKPRKSLSDFYNEVSGLDDGPANSAYKKFLAQGSPNEDDYKPGKIRRLGAILSGAAAGFSNPAIGFKTAESINSQPFDDAYRQWNTEAGRLKEGAAVEQGDYGRRISAAKTLFDADRGDDKTTLENRKTNAEIDNIHSEMEARINDAKAKGWTLEKGDDGITYAVNPVTQERRAMGKVNESINEKRLGNVNEAVAIEAGKNPYIESREKSVAASNIANQLNANKNLFSFEEPTKQDNALALQNNQGTLNTQRDAARHALGTVNPPSESQQELKMKRDANALVSADPSLKKFVAPDGTLLPPTDGWTTTATPQDWNKYKTLYKARYGKDYVDPNTAATPTKPRIER